MEWRPAADIDVSTPRAMDDLGVPEALVHDIVLRVALAMGRTTTLQLCTKLALSPGLMTKVVEDLRDLPFIEIQGMDGRDYRLATTQARPGRGGSLSACGHRPANSVMLPRPRNRWSRTRARRVTPVLRLAECRATRSPRSTGRCRWRPQSSVARPSCQNYLETAAPRA